MRPTPVLATLTGRDRPGVTAAFFAALAAHDVDVRDVEQGVIRERLTLSVLVDLRGDSAALRKSIARAAEALGMACEIVVADDADRAGSALFAGLNGSRSHVVVLGHPLRSGAVGHIAQLIADTGGNIETVSQLSTAPVSALELVVRTPDDGGALQAALVEAAPHAGVGLAVEHVRLRRSAKRLVAVGLGLLVEAPDPLERLAEHHGLAAQSAALAARAAAGELSRSEALRAHAGLLAGLPADHLDAIRDRARPVPGAQRFVSTLRRLGYQVGAVTTGVGAVALPVLGGLGVDLIAGNELEIVDDVLTGALVGEIVDDRTTVDALARYADQQAVPRSQTVAIGDGRHDRGLLSSAGLAVAVTARPDVPFFDDVLFVLGITGDERS
ncbi:MAG TPA: ACT domain-containing protein [Jatrophihabitans sp.]